MANPMLKFLTAVVLMAGVLSSSSVAQAQTPINWAEIVKIIKTVNFRPDRAKSRPARLADRLEQSGDQVYTGRSSTADLRLSEGSVIRMRSNANVTFKPGTRKICQGSGTALYLIKPAQGRTELCLPGGIKAGIRGSALFVRIVPETNTAIIGALTDSGIEVSPADGQPVQVLKAGQMAVVADGQVSLFDFDLRSFYQTSDLVKGFDLTGQSGTSSDPAVAAVQAETIAAVNQQVPLTGSDVVVNPSFLNPKAAIVLPSTNPLNLSTAANAPAVGGDNPAVVTSIGERRQQTGSAALTRQPVPAVGQPDIVVAVPAATIPTANTPTANTPTANIPVGVPDTTTPRTIAAPPAAVPATALPATPPATINTNTPVIVPVPSNPSPAVLAPPNNVSPGVQSPLNTSPIRPGPLVSTPVNNPTSPVNQPTQPPSVSPNPTITPINNPLPTTPTATPTTPTTVTTPPPGVPTALIPPVTPPRVVMPPVATPPAVVPPIATPPVVQAPPVVAPPIAAPPVVQAPPVVAPPIAAPPVVQAPPVVAPPIATLPVAPTVPTMPFGPTAPTAPTAPFAPTAPTIPFGPTAPIVPTAPAAPTAPIAPTVPTAPVTPATLLPSNNPVAASTSTPVTPSPVITPITP